MSKQSALSAMQRNQITTERLSRELVAADAIPAGVDPIELRLGYISTAQLADAVEAFQTLAGLTADGWPGNATLCALWAATRPDEREVAARVVAATTGADVDYVLGAGASNGLWFAKTADEGLGCDCSAFVAWSLLRRKAGGDDWLAPSGVPWWLHTGAIVADATGAQGMFKQCDPVDWTIFAYADAGGSQGHTGWIVKGGDDPQTWEIIDCSSSQSRSLGDAIRRRSGAWLDGRAGVIFCRPMWWPTDTATTGGS